MIPMPFSLARPLRSSLHVVFGALLAATAAGCSASDSPSSDAEEGANTEDFTDVNHSDVKRQSIGNCWLYAVASWSESLHKSTLAGNAVPNFSESYWTYWHWFEQIANGNIGSKAEVSTGGHYSTGVELITRYGVLNEAEFIPEEANAEMSNRQKTALDKINASLKTGALKDAAARRDRALVRRELDKAWELGPNVVTLLDRVFGASVTRTLDRSPRANEGTLLKRSNQIPIAQPDARTHQPVRGTLADAIGRRTTSFGPRTGALAWQEINYGFDARSRREFLRRTQRAMHDSAPVVIRWFVDFNSLDGEGRFAKPPATPGRQGGHMTVLEDYEAEVPGFGLIKAGIRETRPEVLDAALNDQTQIKFLRVKNSWGTFRPDRAFVLPGYHDLHMEYLNGPVKRCTELPSGQPDVNDCFDDTPLGGVVLPPGY
jgi:hypothetical protein